MNCRLLLLLAGSFWWCCQRDGEGAPTQFPIALQLRLWGGASWCPGTLLLLFCRLGLHLILGAKLGALIGIYNRSRKRLMTN